MVYLIRGFRCGTGAGFPLNNGAVSSAGFTKSVNNIGRDRKKSEPL